MKELDAERRAEFSYLKELIRKLVDLQGERAKPIIDSPREEDPPSGEEQRSGSGDDYKDLQVKKFRFGMT